VRKNEPEGKTKGSSLSKGKKSNHRRLEKIDALMYKIKEF